MRNINKLFRNISILFLFFALPSISHSAEHNVYHHKKVKGKNNQTIEYGISHSWHTECNRDQPYGKLKYQSCSLRITDGSKHRSGTYDANGPTPLIEITNIIGRTPKVRVAMGYIFKRGTVATLTIGGKKFTKTITTSSSNQGWWGDEALQIIKLFISKNTVQYDFVANNGRKTGTVSLKGFTNAWSHATNFTGYKPQM